MRRVFGAMAVVFGVFLVAPEAILQSSRIFYYALGLSPGWLIPVFASMSVTGAVMILAGTFLI